jgi:predicted nucleic-acid-binding protein
LPAVDTNILVRFITRDDEEQAQLSRRTLIEDGAWVSKTVLLETEWVLRRGFGFDRSAMHRALSQLLGLPGVEVEDEAEVYRALDYFQAGIDLADALHLASRPSGTPFLTFDQRLISRAARTAVPHVTAPK